MEIVIMAAISVDGFIADIAGGTDWVQDWDLFEKTSQEFGCTVMGHNTFKEGGSTFDDCQHIVLTSDHEKSEDNIHFVNSVEQAIAKAEELGFTRLLVIGGAKANEGFMRSGKVDKLFLDIHPLVLGTGKKLFGDFSDQLSLKLVTCEQHDGFMHVQYEVINV